MSTFLVLADPQVLARLGVRPTTACVCSTLREDKRSTYTVVQWLGREKILTLHFTMMMVGR